MGYQIIKQTATDKKIRTDDSELSGFEPGRFCVFSSVVDSIVAWDLDEQGVVEFFVDMAKEDTELWVKEKLEKINKGLPAYYQFTKPFERAVAMTIERDHESDEDEETPDPMEGAH